MISKFRSSGFGTLIAVISIAASGISTAHAETVMTVKGVDIDSSVFNAYLESRFQKPAAQATAEDRATVERELKDIYLLTTTPKAKELADEPQMKAQLELQKRGAIAQAVARDFVESNPASDAEILAEYEAQLEQSSDLQYKARHILVETQGEAEALIAQLKEGEDFQALAREFSTGPSGPNGGDLGWFAPEQMVKPFAEARRLPLTSPISSWYPKPWPILRTLRLSADPKRWMKVTPPQAAPSTPRSSATAESSAAR